MEAGFWLRPIACAVFVGVLFVSAASTTLAGNHRTQNFIVQAPSPQLAVAVGNAAEKFRSDLAMYWTGSELPAWPRPCPIRVVAGPNLAAQGVTTYNPRPVSDFQMEVVGTPERILDSVLPHEVTHTVLATYFGRPLPRWADEGICTTVEHASERNKHEAKLREFLGSRRGIAMNQLFLLTEYPSDVLPMYAQGYSVCRFLIDQQGPRTFIKFLKDYMHRPSWTANVRKHYGYESLRELQDNWLGWVKSGSGDVSQFAKLKTRGEATIALANAQAPATASLAVANAASPATATLANAAPATATLALNTATSGDWRPNDAGSARLANAAVPMPQKPAPQELSPPPESALAAAGQGQGWYLRLRQQQAEQESQGDITRATQDIARSAVHEPIMPPSVRDSGTYSAAQPQPEQQWSRSGIPAGGVYDGRASRWR
jgi:hypothetical protein